MAEGGISLENARQVDTQINREYELRSATGATEAVSRLTPNQIRNEVHGLEKAFEGKDILSTFQRTSLFAKTAKNPEALLKMIDSESERFVKDAPTETHDGTWLDIRRMKELTLAKNSELAQVANLLWEATARKYEERFGKMPQTPEEKQQFEEAKARAKETTVS